MPTHTCIHILFACIITGTKASSTSCDPDASDAEVFLQIKGAAAESATTNHSKAEGDPEEFECEFCPHHHVSDEPLHCDDSHQALPTTPSPDENFGAQFGQCVADSPERPIAVILSQGEASVDICKRICLATPLGCSAFKFKPDVHEFDKKTSPNDFWSLGECTFYSGSGPDFITVLPSLAHGSCFVRKSGSVFSSTLENISLYNPAMLADIGAPPGLTWSPGSGDDRTLAQCSGACLLNPICDGVSYRPGETPLCRFSSGYFKKDVPSFRDAAGFQTVIFNTPPKFIATTGTCQTRPELTIPDQTIPDAPWIKSHQSVSFSVCRQGCLNHPACFAFGIDASSVPSDLEKSAPVKGFCVLYSSPANVVGKYASWPVAGNGVPGVTCFVRVEPPKYAMSMGPCKPLSRAGAALNEMKNTLDFCVNACSKDEKCSAVQVTTEVATSLNFPAGPCTTWRGVGDDGAVYKGGGTCTGDPLKCTGTDHQCFSKVAFIKHKIGGCECCYKERDSVWCYRRSDCYDAGRAGFQSTMRGCDEKLRGDCSCFEGLCPSWR